MKKFIKTRVCRLICSVIYFNEKFTIEDACIFLKFFRLYGDSLNSDLSLEALELFESFLNMCSKYIFVKDSDFYIKTLPIDISFNYETIF